MKKRVNVYYSGYVQGVGFRFTAEYIARGLGLTGWVKNLPDGKVEVVCEGDESAISDFLNQLENRMKGYISNRTLNWQEYKDEFEEFEIRFY